MTNNKKLKQEAREVAEKIIDLTGYGQKLHINDILPDLEELSDKAQLAENKACEEVVHQFKREARRLNGTPQWRHASEQYAKHIATAIKARREDK